MYDLTDVLPDTKISPGTNVLITGAPLTGTRDLAFDAVASGANRGEGVIIVTTKEGADKVLSEFGGLVEANSLSDVDIGVVDCVTKQRGIGSVEEDSRVKYASSSVDMTGIGIKLSAFLQEFYEDRGVTHNRILLHSVSTLLVSSDLQTVFRFLHVFTARVQSTDALGLYVIDSTAHDDQTMNTLKQLFDAVIEVEEGDGSEPDVRTTGL